MWALRRKNDLLLANGHPDASSYPLGFAADEATLVVERLNRDQASQAVVLQAVAASVMSKEGGKHLNETLKRLTGE